MKQHYSRVPSDHLGRRVHLWTFGDRGQPIVVFPSAAGMAHEWQASGAVDVLAPLITSGRIRLICPESNVSRAWTADAPASTRLDRHRAYERFVLDELIPDVLAESDVERVATTGCSFGAFYATTMALKAPDRIEWALGVSGRYRTEAFLGGFYDDRVYFADPLHFVPNLEGAYLAAAQQTAITLVVGTGAHEGRCIQETHDLAWVLGQKRIPHRTDIWGRDAGHHWRWWRRQIRMHVGHRYG
jgi:esterase/lipase superfamily enzyme